MNNRTEKLRQLEEQLKDINEAIKEVDESIELNNSIQELESNNEDWKKLMSKYLVDEPKRLSGVLTSSAPFKQDQLEQMHAKLDAIRHFRLFMSSIVTAAFHAEESKENIRQQKDIVEKEILKLKKDLKVISSKEEK